MEERKEDEVESPNNGEATGTACRADWLPPGCRQKPQSPVTSMPEMPWMPGAALSDSALMPAST